MTDCTWPRYESHKIVQAAKIVGIARDDDDRIVIWVRAVDGSGEFIGEVERFAPTVQAMAGEAEIDGWAVVYPDNYRSINRAGPFERDYRFESV